MFLLPAQPEHSATMLNYEHQIVQCKWRRMRRRLNPYRQQLPRPNGSFFELHFGDRVIATRNDEGYLCQLHQPKRSGENRFSRN